MRSLEFIKEQKNFIYSVADKYGITDIRIFGSFASGQVKENSDLDLLVKISKHDGMGFDLIRFEREIEEKLNIKLDVVTENSVHHLLKDQIFDNAIYL